MAHSRKYLWQNFTTLFCTRRKILYKAFTAVLVFVFVLFPLWASALPILILNKGTFNNWQCWTQNGYTGGAPSPTTTAPIAGRHDMLSQVSLVMDWIFYGGFQKTVLMEVDIPLK